MNIVVLISGRGSNLEALLNHQKGYAVNHVISNNLNAKGLKIAKNHGVKNTYIRWDDQVSAEKKLNSIIGSNDIDLIVLAGFMRILSPSLVKRYNYRIINIHPSLLPKYPGLNTHERAIQNQDTQHGASIHVVDEQLDHGKVLAQTKINISADDDALTLANKLIIKEHKLLTTTVGLIAAGKLKLTDSESKNTQVEPETNNTKH